MENGVSVPCRKQSRKGNTPKKPPTQINSLHKQFAQTLLPLSAWFAGKRGTVCTNCSEIVCANCAFIWVDVFVPCRKQVVLTRVAKNSDTAFYPQKQGALLLRPWKSTNMTKMAGVTQVNFKSPFAQKRRFDNPRTSTRLCKALRGVSAPLSSILNLVNCCASWLREELWEEN